MKRVECLEAIYEELQNQIVVTIMGAAAQELYDLGHCEQFFYLQHAMGLASSIGLGIAMNRLEEKVVVLDGDGSVLMNMGGLATLGRYRPRNFIHMIFDNGSLLSTGGFDSHTTGGTTDLATIAEGAGCPNVRRAQTIYEFVEAAADAFDADEMFTIVSKVEAVGPDHFGMDFALPENAFRFQKALRERKQMGS